MTYTYTGNCPQCGAPIYGITGAIDMSYVDALPSDSTAKQGFVALKGMQPPPPTAHFTCECRKALPAPLPDDDDLEVESLDDADRKHLARTRPRAEAPSAERAE